VEPEMNYRAAFKRIPGAIALLSTDLTIMDVCDDYVERATSFPKARAFFGRTRCHTADEI